MEAEKGYLHVGRLGDMSVNNFSPDGWSSIAEIL